MKTPARRRGLAWLDSDPWLDVRRSPLLALSALVLGVILVAAFGAPWLAPQAPFDLSALSLADSHLPPAWAADGKPAFLLGTDDLGRDLLSALMHGTRTSLLVGLSSVALSLLIGVTVGLVAAQAGGWVDALLMRVCDVMLSFPPILLALFFDGLGRLLLPQAPELLAFAVLVLALTLTDWVRYARTVRAMARVELGKGHVQAARLLGLRPGRLMRRHVLPQAMGPVLVLATLQVAQAITTEATLSFLGIGVPPTSPSLGSLIRHGYDFLNAGEWWITFFPAAALVLLSLCINLLGDGWREALNPRLR